MIEFFLGGEPPTVTHQQQQVTIRKGKPVFYEPNLQKLLKDVMTDVGFWEDDAQIASETTEKFYARIPGIYIRVEQL